MNTNKTMTNMAGTRPDGVAPAQNNQDATPRGSGVLPLGVAEAGIDPNETAIDPAETIPQIVREMRALGEVVYSTRIMNAWQRARHNFNVQLAAMRKKVSELSSKADAVNETVNKTVNEAVNDSPLSLPHEKEEKREKKQKRVKEERVTPSCSCYAASGGVGAAAAAAGLNDNVVVESDAMRPSEAMIRHFATEVVQLDKEAVNEWLKEAAANEWFYPSGERITRSNFRAPLRSFVRKYLERKKREAEEAKDKSSESSQTRRRYMTWQERAAEEREEAERKLQQRLIDISNTVKLI